MRRLGAHLKKHSKDVDSKLRHMLAERGVSFHELQATLLHTLPHVIALDLNMDGSDAHFDSIVSDVVQRLMHAARVKDWLAKKQATEIEEADGDEEQPAGAPTPSNKSRRSSDAGSELRSTATKRGSRRPTSGLSGGLPGSALGTAALSQLGTALHLPLGAVGQVSSSAAAGEGLAEASAESHHDDPHLSASKRRETMINAEIAKLKAEERLGKLRNVAAATAVVCRLSSVDRGGGRSTEAEERDTLHTMPAIDSSRESQVCMVGVDVDERATWRESQSERGEEDAPATSTAGPPESPPSDSSGSPSRQGSSVLVI
eukprot:2740422-Prymnesium_polylepis.2